MTGKERRLANLKRSLERESARSIDLAMDASVAEEVLADQNCMVSLIEDAIRDLEEEENSDANKRSFVEARNRAGGLLI